MPYKNTHEFLDCGCGNRKTSWWHNFCPFPPTLQKQSWPIFGCFHFSAADFNSCVFLLIDVCCSRTCARYIKWKSQRCIRNEEFKNTKIFVFARENDGFWHSCGSLLKANMKVMSGPLWKSSGWPYGGDPFYLFLSFSRKRNDFEDQFRHSTWSFWEDPGPRQPRSFKWKTSLSKKPSERLATWPAGGVEVGLKSNK